MVENVSAAYLPQNNPPAVHSVTVLTTVTAATAAAPKAGSSASAPSPYSVTVTDTGDSAPVTSTGTSTQTLSRATQQQLMISWQADDPDGDKLVYEVAFRGEGEREWKLLKKDLHESSLTIDGDALADGRYYFKVTASDREANAPAAAKEADLTSSPVLIDNTPPVIRITSNRRTGGALDSALKRRTPPRPAPRRVFHRRGIVDPGRARRRHSRFAVGGVPPASRQRARGRASSRHPRRGQRRQHGPRKGNSSLKTKTLERVISKAGIGSRTQARSWIHAGRVRVNGHVVEDPDVWIDFDRDRILFDDKPLQAKKPVYVLLYKPAGYITTFKDPEGRPTVYDLITDVETFVSPVGRLDLDTSGLLILTNDTQFAERLTNPDHKDREDLSGQVRRSDFG